MWEEDDPWMILRGWAGRIHCQRCTTHSLHSYITVLRACGQSKDGLGMSRFQVHVHQNTGQGYRLGQG